MGELLMGYDDTEKLAGRNAVEGAGFFEEGQAPSGDSSEIQNLLDNDLTTIELKNVLDSLSGVPGEKDNGVSKKPLINPGEPSALSAHTGNVLLTIADVSYFLHRSLEQKVAQIIDEGTILPIFRESVNEYINVSFKDASIGLNNMVSVAIDNKISEVIGTINLEVIVNQVIASTIKGIMVTLPAEMFKIVREITGKEITGMLQDNTPAINGEVAKVVWEAVPGVAERLINNEIEQIKSAFA
ncbi:MAG: hypothetical protein HQK99_08525 [Nitrospirae bacterium]|nr:hypothetical protein [Nitrospirota bacterium]